MYVLSETIKNLMFYNGIFIIFFSEKNLCILHGHVLVMRLCDRILVLSNVLALCVNVCLLDNIFFLFYINSPNNTNVAKGQVLKVKA